MILSVLIVILVIIGVADAAGNIQLPPLPYAYSALEPMISQRTLEIHHDKHHAKYVNTLNSLVEGTDMDSQSLEEIIKASYGFHQGIFNNAAQSWNHAFYWNCMTNPGGGGEPPRKSKLASMITSSFGSFDEFKKEFATAGNTAFGSGWAWLVYNSKEKNLVVTKTIGADNPMTDPSMTPILTMDVWEHAYYLDYQNMRATYVDVFLDKLVNWNYVAENLDRAMEDSEAGEL